MAVVLRHENGTQPTAVSIYVLGYDLEANSSGMGKPVILAMAGRLVGLSPREVVQHVVFLLIR